MLIATGVVATQGVIREGEKQLLRQCGKKKYWSSLQVSLVAHTKMYMAFCMWVPYMYTSMRVCTCTCSHVSIFVRPYVCVCMHACISDVRVCMHIYVHMYVCVPHTTYMCVYIFMCVCVCVYVCVCVHAHTSICMYALHTGSSMWVCMNVYMYTCTYRAEICSVERHKNLLHMCIGMLHTYIHTYTHTYIHTCCTNAKQQDICIYVS